MKFFMFILFFHFFLFISFSQENQSIYFNGKHRGSIVIIPFHQLQNSYTQTHALTYEAWIKPTIETDTPTAIINKAIGKCIDNWGLYKDNSSQISFGTGNDCGDPIIVVKNNILKIGVWQHLSGVWDAESLRLFVNGKLVAIKKYEGNPAADEIDMSIGASNHWNGDYKSFNGFIDEVRYSNVARYKTDFVPPNYLSPDSNTVFLFHFNEGNGNVLFDDSPSKNNAKGFEITWSKDTPDKKLGEYTIDDNTLSLLHFDEVLPTSVKEETHNTDNTTVHGTEVENGRYIRGRKFSGRKDFIEVETNAFNKIISNQELTAESWIHVKRLPRQGKISLLEMRGKKSNLWDISLRNDGKIEFSLFGNADTTVLMSPKSIHIGKWTHVAGHWHKKSNTQMLHIDGNLVKSINSTIIFREEKDISLFIGKSEQETNAEIVLDEIRISDKARGSYEFNIVLPQTGIEVSTNNEFVRLHWTKHNIKIPQMYYSIYRGNDSNNLVLVGKTPLNTFTDSTITESGQYIWTVTATDSTGFESIPLKFISAFVTVPSDIFSYASTIIVGTLILFVFFAWKIRINNHMKDAQQSIHVEKTLYRPSSVNIFGGLTIINPSGKEITSNFSQQMRDLLLILLLHGRKENGYSGISTEKLTTALWRDSSKESAKNARGVALNKFRKLLLTIGDIKVVFEDEKWRLECGESIYCDFLEYNDLLNQKNNISKNIEKAEKIAHILSRGKIINTSNSEVLDGIISSVEQEIPILCIKQIKLQTDVDIQLAFSSAALIWDSLNEDALHWKMKLLLQQNKESLAKNLFEQFKKDYQSTFEKPFPFSYQEFVKNF